MSRIAVLQGTNMLACPLCEDKPLFQIDDHEWGCEECKNTFYITKEPVFPLSPQSLPGTSKKDKDGNPLFPEEIL